MGSTVLLEGNRKIKLFTSNYETIHAAKQTVIIIAGEQRPYTIPACKRRASNAFGYKRVDTMTYDGDASEITCKLCQKNLAKQS
jgi:hypothetical protein